MRHLPLRSPLLWVLASTLLATALALWWPEAPPLSVVAAREPESFGSPAVSPVDRPTPLPPELPRLALEAASFDPFVGAEAAAISLPRPSAVPVPAPPPVPAPAPPAPVAPAVTYRYLGRMDDPHGVRRVYLASGDQAVAVAAGMPLDNGYVVQSIDDAGVKLHYAPLDVTAIVPIPAPPEANVR